MSLPIAKTRYHDVEFGRPGVKLMANEMFVTDQDMVLATILGSCVAACLYDPTTGIGGMNHFMMADADDPSLIPVNQVNRYGDYAMARLLEALLAAGARRDRLEAKVFGGAAVVAGITLINVGGRNATFVRRYLKEQRIRLVAEDMHGNQGRKILFFPRSGEVKVKRTIPSGML